MDAEIATWQVPPSRMLMSCSLHIKGMNESSILLTRGEESDCPGCN